MLGVPTPEAIKLQLSRLEKSAEFAGSNRLFAFLQFVVEETMADGGIGLKEVVIGSAIYGRNPPYDSRIDSTVRVEARRLRRKLVEFYRGTGIDDPVIITLPTGGYVPSFSLRAVGSRAVPDSIEGNRIFRAGRGATLAIMPFRAIPRRPDLDTFADGLADELIFTMGQAEGLWVASRAAAGHDDNRSAADLAKALGVNAVMLGSVREVDGAMRVTVEVSDSDGFVLWSDRFESPNSGPLGDFQDKVARTLLSRARLDSSRMRDLSIEPSPQAMRANAKVYRARLLLDGQTPESIAEAQRLFRQVAESAPDYARGFSGLADCACDLFRLGVVDREEAIKEIRYSVDRALAIDGRSIEANAALATLYAWLERDPPKAEAAFEHVRSLGVSARANRVFGVFLTIFGLHEKADLLFREAREIEPFSTQQDIAETISHYQARRYINLTGQRGSISSHSRSGEVLFFKALAHVFEGSVEGARSCAALIGRRCDTTPDYVFAVAEIEAWLGERGRADSIASHVFERSTCFARASLSAALSDETATLDWLEKALDRGELSTAWMRSDPRFDRFRPSEKFQVLLKRLSPLNAGS